MNDGPGRLATEDDARRAVIDVCLRMNAAGINHGRAGNVSLRWHRGAAEGMLITPSALAYEAMTVEDIVWIALETGDETAAPAAAHGGAAGSQRAPSSEWRMHRDLLASRPDDHALVHTHASFAASLACLPAVQRDGIPAFHYMIAVAGGDDIRCAAYHTFGSQDLSDAVLAAMSGRRACLMANHGMIAAAAGLDAALALAIEVEALCRMYWQATLAGAPSILDARQMREVRARFAASAYGRFD